MLKNIFQHKSIYTPACESAHNFTLQLSLLYNPIYAQLQHDLKNLLETHDNILSGFSEKFHPVPAFKRLRCICTTWRDPKLWMRCTCSTNISLVYNFCEVSRSCVACVWHTLRSISIKLSCRCWMRFSGKVAAYVQENLKLRKVAL